MLLVDFQSQTPSMRNVVLDATLSDPGRTRLSLGKVTSDNIALSELSPSTVQRLVQQPGHQVPFMLRTVFAVRIATDIGEVVPKVRIAVLVRLESPTRLLRFRLSDRHIMAGPTTQNKHRAVSKEPVLSSTIFGQQLVSQIANGSPRLSNNHAVVFAEHC